MKTTTGFYPRNMKVMYPVLFFFVLPWSCLAQIETLPATSSTLANIRQSSNQDFIIGLGNNSFLHFDRQFRLGLGNEFTSDGNKVYVNYAKFHIRHNSTSGESQNSGGPHLLLDENNLDDFARLRFTNSFLSGSTTKSYISHSRFWDIAGRVQGSDPANDDLNFFNSAGGNILTIQGDDKVGINDSSPERALDVNGTFRANGYVETGKRFTSIPHTSPKTK